ncbi:MAG: hypothetical protein MEEGG_00719 [Eggerthella lenta]
MASSLQNLSAARDEYGAFVEYGDKTFLHGESRVARMQPLSSKASYENGSAEFRISFFEDGSLAGFYSWLKRSRFACIEAEAPNRTRVHKLRKGDDTGPSPGSGAMSPGL